jgi:branched-chain amino acid aminotransferase
MPIDNYEKVWHNGKFIPWSQATIHVATHAIHYASALFEGIRCYNTPRGPAIFRLKEHTTRLVNSSKIYRMELPYTGEELSGAMVDLVRVNNIKDCYLRPVVFRGLGEMGVNPLKNPIEVYILAWAWGKYLGDEALRNGVDVCVTSWQRIAPNTLPAMAKCAANYMNAQLMKMEALTNGYTEGISLDTSGHVSEGSGENIFVVSNGKIYTPPLSASVLPGITRESIMTLALEMGYPLTEQNISREMLYIADEVFFAGTAAEITPIRSVDRIVVGKGQPGPITRALQEHFLAIVQGKAEDKYGWLTLCNQPVAAGR